MSRRRRTAVLAGLAAVAALASASTADRYAKRGEARLGELVPAVVARRELPAREPIAPGALAVRRIPARFVPSGTVRSPGEASGLEPRAPIPAGGYLLPAQLAEPGRRRRTGPRPERGRAPVELLVRADPQLAARPGARIDVVVTARDRSGAARPAIAARAVRLLSAREVEDAATASGEGAPAGGRHLARLALTRPQALRLIAAEAEQAEIRLLPAEPPPKLDSSIK